MTRTALILAGAIAFDLGVMAAAAQAQQRTQGPAPRSAPTSTGPVSGGAVVAPAGTGAPGGCTPGLPGPSGATGPCAGAPPMGIVLADAIKDMSANANKSTVAPTDQSGRPAVPGAPAARSPIRPQ